MAWWVKRVLFTAVLWTVEAAVMRRVAVKPEDQVHVAHALRHLGSKESLQALVYLLGAEKVKEAKGGHARHYSHPAEDYVKRIDAAYARGDSRDPGEILATTPPPLSAPRAASPSESAGTPRTIPAARPESD